jgi:hypothetical protein
MHVSQVWCDRESFVCTVFFFKELNTAKGVIATGAKLLLSLMWRPLPPMRLRHLPHQPSTKSTRSGQTLSTSIGRSILCISCRSWHYVILAWCYIDRSYSCPPSPRAHLSSYLALPREPQIAGHMFLGDYESTTFYLWMKSKLHLPYNNCLSRCILVEHLLICPI